MAFNVSSTQQQPAQAVKTISNLSELDIDNALTEQFNEAVLLRAAAAYDETIPLAQKASLINAISSVISAILKQKEAIYNISEVQAIEAALAQTLKQFPDLRAAFLDSYEGKLKL